VIRCDRRWCRRQRDPVDDGLDDLKIPKTNKGFREVRVRKWRRGVPKRVFLFLVLDKIKSGWRRIARTPARNFCSLAASQVREWEGKKRGEGGE
jgi:hypothetical protein